jgi:hypothetical protein
MTSPLNEYGSTFSATLRYDFHLRRMQIFGQRVILWDFPLVLLILVQVTKVLDILLSPPQQKWLQSRVETVTLVLADIKPLRWFRILRLQ